MLHKPCCDDAEGCAVVAAAAAVCVEGECAVCSGVVAHVQSEVVTGGVSAACLDMMSVQHPASLFALPAVSCADDVWHTSTCTAS